MENGVEVSQQNKNRTTIWPSNPATWYTSKGNEISISNRYLHSCVYSIIIYNGQYVESI